MMNKKQLKRQKYTFNISLLKYKKHISKLNRLRMFGKNEHRQNVLLKHIERLEGRLSFLFARINKATTVAAVAAAVTIGASTVNAQTFKGAIGCYENIDGIGAGAADVKFVDIDADGDLDAFITGFQDHDSYLYYENIGSATLPNYATPITDAFNFSHTTLTTQFLRLTFGDLDHDNDLDLMVTNASGDNEYYENIGTATLPDFATVLVNPFGLVDNGVNTTSELVDIDGDGDLDYFVIEEGNGIFQYYQNTGTVTLPVFSQQPNFPFGIWSGSANSTIVFGDMDADGDLDILTPNNEDVYYYENTGSVTAPAFGARSSVPFSSFNIAGKKMGMDIVDYDGDGDWDLVAGSWSSDHNFLYYKNIGTNAVPDFAFLDAKRIKPFGLDYEATITQSAIGDLDNDGDLDIINFKHLGSPDITYHENIGNATTPLFASGAGQINPFGLGGSFSGSPTLVDIDSDGDLDLFRAFYGGSIYYNENTGNTNVPSFGVDQVNPFGISVLSGSSSYYWAITFADLDNDGDLDMLMGHSDGNFAYYENLSTNAIPFYSQASVNPFNLTTVSGGFNASMKPTFVDMDKDGDFDILTGTEGGDFTYIENIGDPITPYYTTPVINPFGITKDEFKTGAYPSFGDFDNDGDLDLFSTGGIATYYENISVFSTVLVSVVTTQGQGGVSTISTPGGSLQLEALLLPAIADDLSYTWDVAASTGAATISATGLLTAISDGFVVVTATANDASGKVGSTLVTISNQVVGIDEDVAKIGVYPNPTTGKVTFATDKQIKQIEILNISGEVIATYFTTNTIDISQLPNGIYIAKVSIENGNSSILKLIKEN